MAPRNGVSSPSRRSVAGRPSREAVIAGPRSSSSPRRSGDSSSTPCRVGDSSRAAGRSWETSGSVRSAKSPSRSIVVRASRSKVGRARTASCSSRLRDAVAENRRSPFVIRPASWPSRSDRAVNTSPVLRTRPRSAPDWERRISSSRFVSWAKGARLPSVALRSSPRPAVACAMDCSQVCRSARVRGSSARRISSSSTVGETRPAGSRPPSARKPALRPSPGVSSTYVSPRSVFWRSVARASRGSGA